MFEFFYKKTEVQVAPGRVTITQENFNYKSDSHLELIRIQTERFNKSLNALQTIDKNILIGLSVGAAGWFGSYLLPLVTVSIGGFMFAQHHISTRGQQYKEYTDALEDLKNVYQWAMSKESGDHWHKLGYKEIQNLISTLGPWVTRETIHTWQQDDLKPSILNSVLNNRRPEISQQFEMQLNQLASGMQTAQWTYRLYGENGIEDVVSILKANLAAQANNLISMVPGKYKQS